MVYNRGVVETRIKERLTGALILVTVMVILVPELLSGHRESDGAGRVPAAGPAAEGPPLRSYTMDLNAPASARPAGQGALTARPPDASGSVLPAPAVVAANTAGAQRPALDTPPPPPPAAARPAPQAAAAAPAHAAPHVAPVRTPPAAPSAAGGWYVRVGSFARRENAQHLAHDLAGKGFATHVDGGANGKLYRVRVGPVADKQSAAALRSRLAARGISGVVMAP